MNGRDRAYAATYWRRFAMFAGFFRSGVACWVRVSACNGESLSLGVLDEVVLPSRQGSVQVTAVANCFAHGFVVAAGGVVVEGQELEPLLDGRRDIRELLVNLLAAVEAGRGVSEGRAGEGFRRRREEELFIGQSQRG